MKENKIQNFQFDTKSMDHDYSVNKKNVFVVDKIPGKSYKLDVTVYPHLYNINVIANVDGNIDLLIGQDYADCFQPLELLKRNENEPYAVRTPLGIVVHGPSSQHVVSNCVVSNLVSVSTPQSDINKLCEIESLDIAAEFANWVGQSAILQTIFEEVEAATQSSLTGVFESACLQCYSNF